MAEIVENAIFTQIVRFDVDPARQDALIAAIVAQVERWIRHRPGFVSSSFHASLDGRHVINYAQWQSQADFEAFTNDPETRALQQAIRDVDPGLKPHAIHCRVVRTIAA